MDWASQYGIPKWWISDGGSHFRNSALHSLAQVMGVKHKFTTAYCPWSNGAVERMCSEVLRTLRAMISELQLNPTDWDMLLPSVVFSLNHHPRVTLGGRSPVEVTLGRPVRTTVDLIFWMGESLQDCEEIPMSIKLVDDFTKKIRCLLYTSPSPRD